MSARASMSDLISRTRQMIRDTAGSPFFLDQEVQDVLDEHRFTVRYAPLRPGPTLAPGALYDYLDYYSDGVGNWESDAQLTWVDFSVITPTSSELIAGHWTVPQTTAAGTYPPIYITGKYYDLYAASADLLDRRIASLALTSFGFTQDGATFHLEQIIQTLCTLRDQYRSKAMAVSHRVRRSDVAGPAGVFSLGEGGPGDVT